jgi:hypothetical protein
LPWVQNWSKTTAHKLLSIYSNPFPLPWD